MEEQQQEKPFIGSIANITGYNDKGAYNFWSGSVAAMKGQRVLKDYYEKNKKDIEKTENNRHKIPFVIIKKPDQYIDKSKKFPRTHSILVGEYTSEVDENLQHDTKLTDNIEL